MESIDELEGQRRKDVPTISKAQRGQIFHMVVAWAELLQSRNEGMTIGGARDVRAPVDRAAHVWTFTPSDLLDV